MKLYQDKIALIFFIFCFVFCFFVCLFVCVCVCVCVCVFVCVLTETSLIGRELKLCFFLFFIY